MKTNVESLVFSMITFSATFPGAKKKIIRNQTKKKHEDGIKTLTTIRTWTLTSSDHCDGRLNVDPLIRVDARVDKDQAVKVWLLTSSQRVLDGVVILKEIPEDYREESIKKKKRTKKNSLQSHDLQTCYLSLCIWQDYCRSVPQSLA